MKAANQKIDNLISEISNLKHESNLYNYPVHITKKNKLETDENIMEI